jgi:hypothetical protein
VGKRLTFVLACQDSSAERGFVVAWKELAAKRGELRLAVVGELRLAPEGGHLEGTDDVLWHRTRARRSEQLRALARLEPRQDGAKDSGRLSY